MGNIINVPNEINRLKKVIVHRPANELNNLMPDYLADMLFDDIPWLESAQKEHDIFVQTLRDLGVEVVYITDLIKQSLVSEDIRLQLIEDFVSEAGLYSAKREQMVREYLTAQPVDKMISTMIAGLRKKELPVKEKTHLVEYLNVDYPFVLDPMANMYFSRDPFAFVGDGVIINKMYTRQRSRETLFAKYIMTYHKDFCDAPRFYSRDNRYNIEGGDVLVLNRETLAIGISQRTHAGAIEDLARNILTEESGFKRILAIDIPKQRTFMHLDTVLTMVDNNVFSVHPQSMGEFRTLEMFLDHGDIKIKLRDGRLDDILREVLNIPVVKFIKCGGESLIDAAREQWNDGANTLCVAPGEIVVYARNAVTNQLFRDNGLVVHEIPCSELSRGRGGPRCMTMPVIRADK